MTEQTQEPVSESELKMEKKKNWRERFLGGYREFQKTVWGIQETAAKLSEYEPDWSELTGVKKQQQKPQEKKQEKEKRQPKKVVTEYY